MICNKVIHPLTHGSCMMKLFFYFPSKIFPKFYFWRVGLNHFHVKILGLILYTFIDHFLANVDLSRLSSQPVESMVGSQR